MRAFLATDLAEELKKNVVEIQNTLSNLGIKGKPTKRDQLHFTIRFLGNINERETKEIKKALEGFITTFDSFKTRICGLDAFPSIKQPRVIWIGASSPKLVELFREVDNILTNIGFERKLEPIPHLTAMRVRQTIHKNGVKEILESLNIDIGEMEVKTISLYESVPSPDGHKHKKLWSLDLNGRKASN